jgi:hypothetical protein
MSKNGLLFLALFCAASRLWAQNDLAPGQRWVEQIDGSFSIPSSAAPGFADPGLGGDINLGYRFDSTWALFAGTGYYQYNITPSPGASKAQLAYLPLTVILRWTWGEGPFHPFLIGGAGLALNTYSQTNAPGSPTPLSTQSQINLYLAPGLGLLYVFSSNMAVFVQSRVDIDFTSHNGLGGELGNPSLFIPLQAGISFFAF